MFLSKILRGYIEKLPKSVVRAVEKGENFEPLNIRYTKKIMRPLFFAVSPHFFCNINIFIYFCK
jgi:hypothetical protein